MKIRHGFISNSSTTSFCIYGTDVDVFGFSDEKIMEWVKANGDEESLQEEYNGEVQDYVSEDYYAFLEWITEGTDLEIDYLDDSYYVGMPYTAWKDDETAKEFRERVETEIKKIIPDATCEHILEAGMDT